MATIVGDVTGYQEPPHPMNVPHLVKKINGFPPKVKSFQNTATYQKLPGGAPSKPLTPPPPLYHGGGMNLRVRPIVNISLQFYLALQDKMKTQRFFNTTMKT